MECFCDNPFSSRLLHGMSGWQLSALYSSGQGAAQSVQVAGSCCFLECGVSYYKRRWGTQSMGNGRYSCELGAPPADNFRSLYTQPTMLLVV